MPEQDVTRAAMALLVTGEDPESEDGRRLTQVVEALHQVTGGPSVLSLCLSPSDDFRSYLKTLCNTSPIRLHRAPCMGKRRRWARCKQEPTQTSDP